MSYTMFDPSKATELAEFQGRFAGIQAGNASATGVAMAPTSIYNQAGYYALQDSDTGYVTLQKLADDSLYTQQWYDQGTGTIFDFTPGGAGIVSTRPTTSQNSSMSASSIATLYGQVDSSSSSSSTSSSINSNLQQYPYGTGYVVVNPSGGESTTTVTNADGTTTAQKVDEDGNPIEISASELQELVDAGIYETVEEALNATLQDGYTVSDDEQKKLGIYNQADEQKIQLMMDTYGLSREEAISKLGNSVGPVDDKNDISAKLYNMLENGFSYEEAVDYLQELGYEVPEELLTPPEQYSDEDEARIAALMNSTGCSREEAISTLGAQPVEEDKPGLIRSAINGIGEFFGGVGKTISDGWNSFIDWLW